jgi:hypothetical protein
MVAFSLSRDLEKRNDPERIFLLRALQIDPPEPPGTAVPSVPKMAPLKFQNADMQLFVLSRAVSHIGRVNQTSSGEAATLFLPQRPSQTYIILCSIKLIAHLFFFGA